MVVSKFAFSLGFLCIVCEAQSTQGLIAGSIRDQSNSAPLASAQVEYEQLDTKTRGYSVSGPDGAYYLPLLPPGRYRVKASCKDYQTREVYDVVLEVAGSVQIDFELRPLRDVWERGRYGTVTFRDQSVLPFFGPDVDPSYNGFFEPERRVAGQLEPSISDVIDPKAIALLPLAGRDVYTALVLQPGVAADTSTARSLGLSANGQRPASSNFLLDGIEDNDRLLGGPSVAIAPEMVQEYRVSTNNYSAEYGRTSGYIANAVTRSGSSQWHGIAYADLGNDQLDANSFQHNATGAARSPLRQTQSGFSAGGPIPHTKLLSWTALDHFGSSGENDAHSYILPTLGFAESLSPGSRAWQILHDHPPVQWAPGPGDAGEVSLSAPITLKRNTLLERLDYSPSGRQHYTGRLVGSWLDRPDFYWDPYGRSSLTQDFAGIAVGATNNWTPSLTTEVRAGWQISSRGWGLTNPNLPQLLAASVRVPQLGFSDVDLPGSCCQSTAWQDRGHTTELAGSIVLVRKRHLLKAGTGLFVNKSETNVIVPYAGAFFFTSLDAFAADDPLQFRTIISRTAEQVGVNAPPNPRDAYRNDEVYAFVQEDLRVSRRFTLNFGVRFDRIPAPVASTPSPVVVPGPGASLDERIASASLQGSVGSLFTASTNNWAGRFGFSYAPFASSSTVLRGGYGQFYDRAFDNIWLTASTNDLMFAGFGAVCAVQAFYRSGQYQRLPANCSPGLSDYLDVTMFQPMLRSPRVQSFFLSAQQAVGRNLSLALNGTGSLGRGLITTDVLNRLNGFFRPNDNLPNIDYRANQGSSDYTGLSAVVRYRSARSSVNIAWTWSHSIDNQSDPLLGSTFDLGFSNQTDRSNRGYYAAFSFPYASSADRGNSDFDQQQNLVAWATFEPPGPRDGPFSAPLRNWSVAAIFAARSGLPYTVYAGEINCDFICDTRAQLVRPDLLRLSPTPITGGLQLLDPAAFSLPPANMNGNTGRNAFRGPGFWNLDLSLAREFPLRVLGEQFRLTIRADAFNIFNHANLQNPEAFWGDSAQMNALFGQALYGRIGQRSSFPALTPLIENPRQVQILLRLRF
jgi:hypothetical protein